MKPWIGVKKIKDRENIRGIQESTTQRHRQHWAQETERWLTKQKTQHRKQKEDEPICSWWVSSSHHV